LINRERPGAAETKETCRSHVERLSRNFWWCG
jgi:hypothetical protein